VGMGGGGGLPLEGRGGGSGSVRGEWGGRCVLGKAWYWSSSSYALRGLFM